MSWSIFVDTERCAAILMNDEPLFALGPAVVADEPEEAVQVIEMFCEALEAPPDECPTIRLMTEWSAFLTVIFRPEAIGLQGAQEAAGDDGIPEGLFGLGDPSDGLEVAGSEAEASTGEDGPGPGASAGDAGAGPRPIEGDPDDDETGEEDDEDEIDMRDRLAQVPGGTPAQRGEVDCWACGGAGAITIGKKSVDCSTCEGTGRLRSAVA